jgi:two-component system, LytTR family, response regulator
MMIRVLVVDDQPIARERIVSLLADESDIEVVATAGSGPEAVDAVQRLKPDLVFLDMQMPELDGFGVIETIGADRMPPTVFVTAYDQYSIRAFEVHALDYLLKPFGRIRFQKALARARLQLDRNRSGELAERLLALVDQLRGPDAGKRAVERVMVRAGGRVAFVDVDHIDWVEAEGNYARLHVGQDTYLQRETMVSLLARLGEDDFFRIHRSRIVNVSRIRELKLAAGGDYDVILRTGVRLGLSRLYKDALQARLAAPRRA